MVEGRIGGMGVFEGVSDDNFCDVFVESTFTMEI